MNDVENGVIKYQIDFEKYKNGQADEIISLLDRANREIADYIRLTKDVATKKRYKEIRSKLKEVSSELKAKVKETTDLDGLIDYELKKTKKLFGLAKEHLQKVETGTVNFIYPSVEQIKTAALFKPYDKNGTYQSYLEGIEAGLFNTWDATVRTGYLIGMPTKEIVDTVMGGVAGVGRITNPGIIQSLRNSVYANTRTLLQAFANEAQNMMYEANEEYFGDGEYKYEYLSTLDSRTCLVCAECGGKLYKSIKEAPQIPQHRGCRCMLVPYFPPNENEKRSSKRGYVDNISYEEWLNRQSDKVQKDVLGKSRYNMFKKGTSLKQFVDNGEVISLDNLVKKLGIEDS